MKLFLPFFFFFVFWLIFPSDSCISNFSPKVSFTETFEAWANALLYFDTKINRCIQILFGQKPKTRSSKENDNSLFLLIFHTKGYVINKLETYCLGRAKFIFSYMF